MATARFGLPRLAEERVLRRAILSLRLHPDMNADPRRGQTPPAARVRAVATARFGLPRLAEERVLRRAILSLRLHPDMNADPRRGQTPPAARVRAVATARFGLPRLAEERVLRRAILSLRLHPDTNADPRRGQTPPAARVRAVATARVGLPRLAEERVLRRAIHSRRPHLDTNADPQRGQFPPTAALVWRHEWVLVRYAPGGHTMTIRRATRTVARTWLRSPPMRSIARSLALCAGFLVLSACGGGGGSDSGTPQPGQPMPPTAQMNAAENQMARDALDAMNVWRGQQPGNLTALQWYQPGAQVAYAHCLRMEADGFFLHVDPGTGKDPATRALDANISHDPQGSISPQSGNPFVGENLYGGTGGVPTGQAAVNSWSTSPGHNTQMVAPNPVPTAQTMPAWTHCGIGVRWDGTQYWFTAMFFRNPN